jgi:hypothetical protein
VGQRLLLRAGIQKTSLRPDRKEGFLKTGSPVCIETNREQEYLRTGDRNIRVHGCDSPDCEAPWLD